MTISFNDIKKRHFVDFKIDLLLGGNKQPIEPPSEDEENPPVG